MSKPVVCLLLEGTYPFITGGVSSWVHQLIQAIPDVDFKLFSISPSADQDVNYTVPGNVIEHVDTVLTEAPKKKVKLSGRKKHELFSSIKENHGSFFAGSFAKIDELLKTFPEEADFNRMAVQSDTGWDLISRMNQKQNPVYPFNDYYWAWKSAHAMIFKVVGARLPEADVYHAVSTGYAGLLGSKAKVRLGKSFVLTEHGLYHKEREMEIRKAGFIRGYQRDLWTKIYSSLSKIAYQKADMVISLFEENRKKQIAAGAVKHKTIVIPNGIDIPRFSAVKREEKKGFHVGLVGRVVPIKDIKTFIASSKVIHNEIPEARFYCIGPADEDPSYYEECKLLRDSLKLNDVLEFTGRQDVRSYYSFLDVLLLTSVREAQPLVILEAFMAGVPVVSTNVGNVAEMLDFNEKLLAQSRDSRKIADGVIYLYKNPDERKKLVEDNKIKIPRFYDRKKVFQQYNEIYHKMAGKVQ